MSKELSMTVDTQAGQVEISDEERQPCEIWTRVMGYYRPVTEFNIGKKQEYEERINFSESEPSYVQRKAS